MSKNGITRKQMRNRELLAVDSLPLETYPSELALDFLTNQFLVASSTKNNRTSPQHNHEYYSINP